MKRMLLILLLAGCASPNEEFTSFERHGCCSERISVSDIVTYSHEYHGILTPSCYHWCKGETIVRVCACKEGCPCKE